MIDSKGRIITATSMVFLHAYRQHTSDDRYNKLMRIVIEDERGTIIGCLLDREGVTSLLKSASMVLHELDAMEMQEHVRGPREIPGSGVYQNEIDLGGGFTLVPADRPD